MNLVNSSPFKLSILVPVFNEVGSLAQIIDKILRVPMPVPFEIILVDSGSSDGSTELVKTLAEKHNLRAIHLPQNLGKGYSIRRALKESIGNLILIQDADLEYDPADYPALLAPLIDGRTQFVMGSRQLKLNSWRFRSRDLFRLRLEVVNWGSEFLTRTFCLLYCVKLTDTQSMYKVFHKSLLDGVDLRCNGFDLDIEILSHLVSKGHVPLEIPVHYRSRDFSEGKKLRVFSDGLAALFTMVKIKKFK